MTSLLENRQCPYPEALSTEYHGRYNHVLLLWTLPVSLGPPFTKFTNPPYPHTQLSTASWLPTCIFLNTLNSLTAKPFHVLLPKARIHFPPLPHLHTPSSYSHSGSASLHLSARKGRGASLSLSPTPSLVCWVPFLCVSMAPCARHGIVLPLVTATISFLIFLMRV